jgi:hypothetical protein
MSMDVDRIKASYNLVDFVLQHQGLQIEKVERTANGVKIRSPFRSERTPSFHVTPQYFKDFGDPNCKGDIIKFVQMLTGKGFKDALEYLGGTEQLEKAKPPPIAPDKPKELSVTMNDVFEHEQNLAQILPYLESRGISKSVCQHMRVGAKQITRKYIMANGKTIWFKCWQIAMPYVFENRLLSIKYRRDDTSARAALRAAFPLVKDPVQYMKLDLSAKNNDEDPDSFSDEQVFSSVFGIKFRKYGPASIYNANLLVGETPDGWRYPRHTAVIASPEGKEIDVLSLLTAGFPAVGVNPGTKADVARTFQNVRVALIPRDNEPDQKSKTTGEWINPGMAYGQALFDILGSHQDRARYIDPPDGFKDLNDLAKVNKLTDFLTRKPYFLEPCLNLI